MSFNNGWLQGAAHRPTPNRYTQHNPREIIVMHYTAGYQASSAINTFLSTTNGNPASAHFVVETDGSITQMVSTDECAWHAGHGEYHGRPKVNLFSIGIEIVNPGYHYRAADGSYLNWQRRPVSAAQLAPFPGMIEAAEPWAGSARLSWPNFPEAQLAAVEQLTRDLIAAYPSIVDIVGHRDVDGVRKLKVDPGPAFPMRRFRMLLDDRQEAPEPTVPAGAPAPASGVPAPGPGVPGPILRVNLPGDTLNVRGGPGTAFELLSWSPLNHGDQVQRLGVDGPWYRVRRWINGTPREGWVYARYLAPL